jgi:hypothetical protein
MANATKQILNETLNDLLEEIHDLWKYCAIYHIYDELDEKFGVDKLSELSNLPIFKLIQIRNHFNNILA